MVELAQTYQIRDWIGPALMALFLMSFQDFSDEQLHQLDVVVLGMLGKVQATLVSQCKYIVERVIKLNHSRPVNGMSISCKNNVILA